MVLLLDLAGGSAASFFIVHAHTCRGVFYVSPPSRAGEGLWLHACCRVRFRGSVDPVGPRQFCRGRLVRIGVHSAHVSHMPFASRMSLRDRHTLHAVALSVRPSTSSLSQRRTDCSFTWYDMPVCPRGGRSSTPADGGLARRGVATTEAAVRRCVHMYVHVGFPAWHGPPRAPHWRRRAWAAALRRRAAAEVFYYNEELAVSPRRYSVGASAPGT